METLKDLSVKDLIQLLENTYKELEDKLDKTDLDCIDIMNIDDEFNVFNRLEDISNDLYALTDEVTTNCYLTLTNMFNDVMTDEIYNHIIEHCDTWGECIDVLLSLRDKTE